MCGGNHHLPCSIICHGDHFCTLVLPHAYAKYAGLFRSRDSTMTKSRKLRSSNSGFNPLPTCGRRACDVRKTLEGSDGPLSHHQLQPHILRTCGDGQRGERSLTGERRQNQRNAALRALVGCTVGISTPSGAFAIFSHLSQNSLTTRNQTPSTLLSTLPLLQP